ncbi:MAG: hypothetical protein Q8T13_03370 [Acidobacteriota bacterium]|nr:hypothetical protein [Acidobacteriota bacterium]
MMSEGKISQVVVAVTAIGFLGLLAAVAAPAVLLFGVSLQIAFILPGIAIARAVAGPALGWLVPLAVGPLLGQALASLALTAVWAAGGRGIWVVLAASLLAAGAIVPARRLQGRWRLPATAPGDRLALAALLLIVPVVVGLPFAHVGEITADGQFYRAYFTADYVWRRAVVAELAKGAFLPVNPYLFSDTLNYYWMPHLLTAAQYRFAGAWATLDELLLIRSVCIDAFLVTFLYGVVRVFGVRPWASAAGVAFVILSSSFEGLYAWLDFASHGVPAHELTNLNIDAITRWYLRGIPIDGLQRLLFYQPHHVVGYAAGLMGVLAVSQRSRAFDPVVMAVAGLLLGLSIAISSFAGVMFTAGAALFEAVSVARQADWRRGLAHAVSSAIPLALASGMVFALRYVDADASIVQFGVNQLATQSFWLVTALSFGPVLIVSAAAIAVILRQKRQDIGGLAALAAACGVFYFFINVRDHQDVYVGWRVGHLLFMAATVLAGILFDRLPTMPHRRIAVAAIVAVFVAGLPTTIIDIYNTQDITNNREAPGFRWTLRLTPDDRQAFHWIRLNTEPDAIIQVDPFARDAETWAYLPAFAERRMAAGLPISMVPLKKYQEASEEVRSIFDEPPLSAYERAVRSGINYVLVGPPELDTHPGVTERLDSLPELMPLLFRNGTISIYGVKTSR